MPTTGEIESAGICCSMAIFSTVAAMRVIKTLITAPLNAGGVTSDCAKTAPVSASRVDNIDNKHIFITL